MLVKVQSLVFTAKCSEPQPVSSNVNGELSGVASSWAYEQKLDIRQNGVLSYKSNRSPKYFDNVNHDKLILILSGRMVPQYTGIYKN